jgi:leader peptidase (prepilin peptidase)/N-methyltransferase
MIMIAVLLGFIIGFFINLAANSLPENRRLENPHCHACGGPRALIAWSAIIAWLSGNQDCDYCGRRILQREIVLEVLIIMASILLFFTNSSTMRWLLELATVSIFLLILIIDLEHRLILHVVSIPAAIYFAIIGSVDPELGFSRTLVGGIVGFGFFLLLYILGALFANWAGKRRGEEIDEVAFGFGDVMLALVIGLAIGFPGVIWALLQGILLAGFFSLLYLVVMAIRKRYEAYTAIPYGPFLIIGALLVYFLGDPYSARLLGL